jgi:hydroxyacylglutathione hydrolase
MHEPTGVSTPLRSEPNSSQQGSADGGGASPSAKNSAGMAFEVLHTPGHTRGSVCLKASVDSLGGPVLFSGDHLFAGSIGRTDLPGGSFDALMDSMKRKILPLDDELAVLPGHGPATTIGRERVTNPFIVELLQGGFD